MFRFGFKSGRYNSDARRLADIFAATTGIWYDPQDLTTKFQDATGTLPVYRPGSGAVDPPVGLMLDKSRGLELGPELFAFVPPVIDNYTSGARGAYDESTHEMSNTAAGSTAYNPGFKLTTLSPNIFYKVRVVFSGNLSKIYSVGLSRNSPAIGFVTGGISGSAIAAGGGMAEWIGTVSSNAQLTVWTDGRTTWDGLFIESISIREIKGYHAYQSTTTARPTLSGRYNILTATETLATQSVTTVATNYTLRFEGTGSVTLSGTATGVKSAGTHTITCTAGTLTCTVSGSVTKADLRRVTGQVLPAYQAVVNANTYDTAGFPLYLRRDLTDDKHTLIVPTGGITGTRLQTTLDAVATTSETMAAGTFDMFAVPSAGPREIAQWLQFNKALSASELAVAERFAKSQARLV